jgi:uncharacterized phage protein (TIGR02220 family)
VRARNIKPGYFKNECLADCNPLARILFAGLWCLSDKEGRFEWRPRRIKAEVLPYDDCEIDKLLGQLVKCGFLEYYSMNGSEYGAVVNFKDHQNPHPKDAPSKLPEPPGKTDSEELHGNSGNSALNLESLNLESGILNKSTVEQKRSTVPFQEIIFHLNLISSRNFSPKTKSSRNLIKARWDEGRTLEDFKRVHKIKWEEWKSDDEMMKFYRPETLYNAKHFESYLNQRTDEDQNNARRERLRRKYGKDV